MNTAQISSTAFLVVTVWLACGTGCSEYEPPAVHCMNNTPGLWFSAFRLPEAEWGKPDDVLAMSWYMTSEWTAYAWYRDIWCERVRVLHADERGRYRIPNETIAGYFELTPLLPQITKQRYPMVCVLDGKGKFGIHHRENLMSYLEWYPFQDAPRLEWSPDGYRINQAKGPPEGSRVRPELGVYSIKTPTADTTLGCLVCYLLAHHRPAGSPAQGDQHRVPRITEEDARAIAEFVERHPGTYSKTTRLLWGRLAGHYDRASQRREGRHGYWGILEQRYQRGIVPDREFLIRVLPEREQLLVLGSYTRPDRPFDPKQEAMGAVVGVVIRMILKKWVGGG